MWEQRYGILTPKRTESNIRYYDDEDVRHLLNVTLLNRNGLKISKIAKLSRAEMTRRVAELTAVSDEYSTQLDALTLSMLEMDEARFDRILNMNIDQIGFESTMLTVIFPFLEKLSVLWMTGSVKPVQEAFTSLLIRRKLLVAIEQLPHPEDSGAPSLVLYLPEGEAQEMSLVLLHYLARARGIRVFYLGRDISLIDLEDSVRIIRPDYVFTMLTESFAQGNVAAYVSEVLSVVGDAKLLLSGYQALTQPVPNHVRVQVLNSMHATLDYLESLLVEQAA